MSRYELPDPKCRHKRKGIVKAGEWDGAHASTAVCDREACITDALEWANAHNVGEAVFIPDRPTATAAASLFDAGASGQDRYEDRL